MNRFQVSALALTAALVPTAFAAAQAPALPAGWTNAALAGATYVILDPRIEGNPGLLSAEQQAGILKAMRTDSAGAISRHYPNAKFVTDPATPGAVKVSPVLVTPGALVPWAKLSARLDLQLADGSPVSLNESFGLLTLWQQGPQAANYAYDRIAQRLP